MLLALRRDDASSWSLAVCTASDGAEYHPQYPVPLRSEANFDPCLFLRGIASEKVLDSAVWARLSNPHPTPTRNPNPNPNPKPGVGAALPRDRSGEAALVR